MISFISRQCVGMLLLALGSIVLSICPARADVLFSNLPFTSRGGESVTGPSTGGLGYFELAVQFTSPETANLDSIQIPFYHFIADNNALTISLYTSVNNSPGVVLTSQDIPANTLTGTGTLYTINFGGSPLLLAGTSYFVDATTTGDNSDVWGFPQPLSTVPAAYRTNPAGSFIAANLPLAFQVNGIPADVPEPSTIAFLTCFVLIGAATFLSRRKAARKAT